MTGDVEDAENRKVDEQTTATKFSEVLEFVYFF